MVGTSSFGSASTLYLSGQKSPTVLHLPFSPSLCIEHLLEHFDENLKGSLGFFKTLILVKLYTLTMFQGSILAAIFCCTQQGESLILMVEGF